MTLRLFIFMACIVVVKRANAQITSADSAYVHSFVSALNRYRTEHRLPPLSLDYNLNAPAVHHCQYLCRLWLEHPTSFVLSHDERVAVEGLTCYRTAKERFEHFGIDSEYGECAGYVQQSEVASPDDALAQWKSSPPHNAILLNAAFRRCSLATMWFKSNDSTITINVLTLSQ